MEVGLIQVLMRRAVWISLACLGAVLLLALWRAQSDVSREGQGADEVAQLVLALGALQTVPEAQLAGQLAQLAAIEQSGRLRHLQLQLQDDSGRSLLPVAGPRSATPGLAGFAWLLGWLHGEAAPAADESRRWLLQRPDGRRFHAILRVDPHSEQQEALGNILGLAGALLGYGLILLLAMYWALRHAFAPLRSIVAAIDGYVLQNYTQRLPPMAVRELEVIRGALNHLAAALDEAQEVQRGLRLKLLTLQEDERAQLARELHDEFGQHLTAMRVDSAYLLRQTAAQPALQAVAGNVDSCCQRIQHSLRDLLRQLRPLAGGNGEAGGTAQLKVLLQRLVHSWREQPEQSTHFQLHVDLGGIELPQALALSLYRLTQEALTNVARHARATTVDIALHAAEGDIVWSVRDDGIGLGAVAGALHHGNGLAGMRERVWAHGGSIDIGPACADAARPGTALAARLSLAGARP
jgi:two-component system sensor histidine kinase UhpB